MAKGCLFQTWREDMVEEMTSKLNLNLFIHSFIQPVLAEDQLYAKRHYVRFRGNSQESKNFPVISRYLESGREDRYHKYTKK